MKVIFLIFSITLVLSIYPLKIQSVETKENQSTGKLTVDVDDELLQVTINGVAQDITKFANRNTYRTLDSVSFPFKQGDVVAIAGKNNGVYSEYNPGYMNAEIIYFDNNNAQQRIVTNTKDWKCYEFNPTTKKRVGSSSVSTYGLTPFNYPVLIKDAEWIWNGNKRLTTVECEVSLGIKPTGKLTVTVDDALLQVTINGVAQDITKFTNRNAYRTLDTVNLPFKQGDVVALVGQNYGTFSAGNPGYMNVEIVYFDNNNALQRIVSDTENWKCFAYNLSTKKRVAVEMYLPCSFGLNPYKYPTLIKGAQWIWSCNTQLSVVECETTLGAASAARVTSNNSIEVASSVVKNTDSLVVKNEKKDKPE
jgi:hypothetical protein